MSTVYKLKSTLDSFESDTALKSKVADFAFWQSTTYNDLAFLDEVPPVALNIQDLNTYVDDYVTAWNLDNTIEDFVTWYNEGM